MAKVSFTWLEPTLQSKERTLLRLDSTQPFTIWNTHA